MIIFTVFIAPLILLIIAYRFNLLTVAGIAAFHPLLCVFVAYVFGGAEGWEWIGILGIDVPLMFLIIWILAEGFGVDINRFYNGNEGEVLFDEIENKRSSTPKKVSNEEILSRKNTIQEEIADLDRQMENM